MSRFAAIVLSAGKGTRMGSEIPKQYLLLHGKPVIYYSLKAFEESDVSEVILVTGKDDVSYCKEEIVKKYQFAKVKDVIPGGRERYDSVFEGIKALKNTDYVLIHDGARPVLTQEMITNSMATVVRESACVVGMPVKDTIKIVDDERFAIQTPERNYMWQVQTPQTFSYELIRGAYEKMYVMLDRNETLPTITDDAMVVEYFAKQKVKLIPGDYENIKITTQEDLAIAELFLRK